MVRLVVVVLVYRWRFGRSWGRFCCCDFNNGFIEDFICKKNEVKVMYVNSEK